MTTIIDTKLNNRRLTVVIVKPEGIIVQDRRGYATFISAERVNSGRYVQA